MNDKDRIGNQMKFSQTGKYNLSSHQKMKRDDFMLGSRDDESSDDELNNLIANSNFSGAGGIKSQTLQFQTQLGNEFLNLFAVEKSDDEGKDGDDDDEEGDLLQDGYADFEDD